ncbi:hypothetical protein [Azospirillum picis]|uniref:Secreted protein n=1 Tax=Azospirillum picis TaxID=488438 RepID=A0ABU0MEJ6_9PROT|nr:hypothetical protein [Azospirillum picis]MBP2298027.1 hypothetical protein [Azospirillum picis]MDQ0531865.1 hypothetical protein [Azospirillum picis]
MVRVTAFLRAALTAALWATTLVAASPSSWAASPTAQSGTPGHAVPAANGRSGSGSGSGSGAGTMPGNTVPQPTTPAAICLKPGAPVCMDDPGTFVSADKMSSCQGEVKEYVDKTMAYLTCLNDENVATGKELGRNVDRFNCRLSGRKGCN